jgi:beta-fructofuranosidase
LTQVEAQIHTAAHLRPAFHVRPPRGYLNDPNGPIEVGDDVHLYFQYRPTLSMDVPVEWGHVTSTDYVRWTLHRPAMAPQPGGPDTDGCWSGNTVLDDGRIRAFYSGCVEGHPYQSVLTAVSDDGGASFGPARQVIPDPDQAIMFRDPFVWKENGTWWMTVGAGYAGRGANLPLYRSTDLETWSYVGPLVELPRGTAGGEDTGAAWECPQMLTIDGRRIAVVASWSPESGPASVLSFDVDVPPVPQRVDHGTNFYAASALRDSRFGPLLFGWLTEGRDRPGWTDDWAGVISLPRVVWLGSDASLRSAPVPTVDTLRTGPGVPADGCTTGPQCEIAVPEGPGRVVIHFGEQEQVVIELDADTLTIDRTQSSLAPHAHRDRMQVADAFDPASGRPAARIFLDGSVLEVFTSAGRVLSTRVYPATPPTWQVEAPSDAHFWTLDC